MTEVTHIKSYTIDDDSDAMLIREALLDASTRCAEESELARAKPYLGALRLQMNAYVSLAKRIGEAFK